MSALRECRYQTIKWNSSYRCRIKSYVHIQESTSLTLYYGLTMYTNYLNLILTENIWWTGNFFALGNCSYALWVLAANPSFSWNYNWNILTCNDIFIYLNSFTVVSRENSVGIVIRYGLGGPGIESRWGRDFLHPTIPTLGPTQSTVKWLPGLIPEGRETVVRRSPPTPF